MEEKDVVTMDLRFLNVIMRFCLVGGDGMSMSIVIARWSEMVRSVWVILLMVVPDEQTRSSVCPFLWVGKSICWLILKRCKMSRKSVVVLESVESMWMLKLPNRRMDGDMAQSWDRNSDRSERNAGFVLGRAVDSCNDQGFSARQFE